VGLAEPGTGANWWQDETKGYQFWARADANGKRVVLLCLMSGDCPQCTQECEIMRDFMNSDSALRFAQPVKPNGLKEDPPVHCRALSMSTRSARLGKTLR
jgi:hypothetical protein